MEHLSFELRVDIPILQFRNNKSTIGILEMKHVHDVRLLETKRIFYIECRILGKFYRTSSGLVGFEATKFIATCRF